MIVNRTLYSSDGLGNCPSTQWHWCDDEAPVAFSLYWAAILCKYTWKPLLENMTDCQNLINIQLQIIGQLTHQRIRTLYYLEDSTKVPCFSVFGKKNLFTVSISATARSGLEIGWQPLSPLPPAELQPVLSQVRKLLNWWIGNTAFI